MMGIIEELREIQETAKIESTIAAEKARREEEAQRAEEERVSELEKADADLSGWLETIKNHAKKRPYQNEIAVSLGIVSRTYAERTAENFGNEGLQAVLKSRYHKAQDYGDEGYHDAYTTYTVEVGWR